MRGQVWLVAFDKQTRGREQRGIRPALVISSDDFNLSGLDLVVVIPITTSTRPFASHIPVKRPEGGLEKDSSIMCEQIKSISKKRLVRRLGSINEATMGKVEEIIANILELPF
ncbi:MAG: type II toxin-antitoxin system PemK/MazF family toxin [Actinomycetota bacterium]|nr:type II toxin-antitoxin system PemK/MazF family toxin [Actinomycetota bacterium]